MKKKLLQSLGRAAFFVLRRIDRYFGGAYSGMSPAEQLRDPHRAFRILRNKDRLLRTYTNRGWMVLGFEEVQTIFKDPRFGTDIRKNSFLSRMFRLGADGRTITFLDNPTMLNLDPPDHTRLRKLVSQGFLHKFILSLEPRIEAIVQQCLDDYDRASGQYDIVEQLAKPLPAIVIAELLGLPEDDLPRFQRLSDDLIGLTAFGNDRLMERGSAALEELMHYFAAVVEAKRRQPDQALISRLIEAEEEGDRLTTAELYSTCILVLVAGHETTTRLISNGMYALLQHPDQMQLFRDDLSLTENAIEEMLRYDSPVQVMPRFAHQDVEIFGRKIRKNQLMIMAISSANRDEAANPNPDVFDITRTDIRHVAFGHGIHLCLGMTLARLEGRIAIRGLVDRFPDMSLAEQELSWIPVPLIRGMENLYIDTNEASVQEMSTRTETRA